MEQRSIGVIKTMGEPYIFALQYSSSSCNRKKANIMFNPSPNMIPAMLADPVTPDSA
jgi:hypothetical protein